MQAKGKESVASVVNGRDDKTGYTSLHFAVEGGYLEIVSLLLEKGADVNSITHNSATALHLAIRNKDNYKIVTALLDKGANPNTADRQRFHFVDFFFFSLSRNIFFFLCSKLPLCYAINNQDEISFRALLEKGADPKLDIAGNGGTAFLECASDWFLPGDY